VCEDSLICDLAETYHLFNYREQSPELVAVLCFGLRDDSRVKLALANSKLTLEQILTARMVDELAWLHWSKTKDGSKNRNQPPSILKALTEEKREEAEVFLTADEFNEAWEKIINAEQHNR
jgi:hypothetical protein